MKKFTIRDLGNVRGQNGNPDNRVAKLAAVWGALTAKMERLIVQGHGETLTARCAYTTLLIMETGIRVGNEASANGYRCINPHDPNGNYGKRVKTYGAITLLRRHVQKRPHELRLNFIGKKQVRQVQTTRNKTLRDWLPTPAETSWLGVEYIDLHHFCWRYVGRAFTPKDLRRVRVNQVFLKHLNANRQPLTQAILKTLIETTANEIGHTQAVCKSSYLSKTLLTQLNLLKGAK